MAEVSPSTREQVRGLIAERFGIDRVPAKLTIVTDTSDFFRLNYNDVLALDDRYYWIKRYEKEGRFGLDDEPKYWVRRAVDLQDGSTRILKLVFHEKFETRIGGVTITCFRSPKKEARILDLVAGHPHFMHGSWTVDTVGNNVRILEFIPGPRLDEVVTGCGTGHEDYFYNYFPKVLREFIVMVRAIQFLHEHGEKHGDIRRDHILFDRERGVHRWIDFDYNYLHGESMWGFDLQGLGNIIIFLAGRGDVLVPDLYHTDRKLFDTLWGEDLNISYRNRVANLKKIYPYIPESLNRVLLHFSQGAQIFYEHVGQLLDDLAEAEQDVSKMTGGGT
ncbi:MAG: hypothetical protein Kow0089_21650 [Desulfobulbaceae bacterium]